MKNILNLTGISNKSFQLGKNGVTIHATSTDPTLSGSMLPGDVWINPSTSEIKIYGTSAWDTTYKDIDLNSLTDVQLSSLVDKHALIYDQATGKWINRLLTNADVSGLGTMATQNASSVSITGGSITGITDLAIADGGTGASTAADARTNLGLGSIATQNSSTVTITGGTITGITDLAIADGGTGASTAAGARTNLELGTIATQNSNLVTITGGSITGVSITDITDLAIADGGTGASTAADARTNLGLGTIATQDSSTVSITGGSITGITDLAIADGGTGASTAADARTNLGLGTIATQESSNVSITGGSIAGITDLAIADGGTGASTAADARTNLGLGTIATQNASSVSITGGSITNITDLAVADGGTGASNATDARTNLGAAPAVALRHAINALSTGVYTFTGGVTIADATHFNVGAMTGAIVDNETDPTNPIVTFVSYPGGTNLTTPYLATSQITHIFVDSTGSLYLQPTPPTQQERRQRVYLGRVSHGDFTTITLAGAYPDIAYSNFSQVKDFLSCFTIINDGIKPYPNGINLSINTTAGNLHQFGADFVANKYAPSRRTIPAQIAPQFFYRTQNGGPTTPVTVIDPLNYDVGGTVTPISTPNARSTNQRIYMTGQGAIVVQYGQTVYNSLSEAIAAAASEPFVQYSTLIGNTILIGILSIRKDCTDLSDPAHARFFSASKLGESGGSTSGTSTATLQSAYNNSQLPQIVTNTTFGSVTIQRGSALDTDQILTFSNGAGTTTASVTGNGVGTFSQIVKTGGLSTEFLKADGSSDATSYQPLITAGTTSQYYRGDKTFQTLDKTAVGLSNVTNDAQLKITSNLSDLASAATARTNLGLGTSATVDLSTDVALTANSDTLIPSQKAVKTYVDTAVTGLLDLKGDIDCSTNPNYPAALKGDTYVVSVAGKIGGASGVNVDVGDQIVAKVDTSVGDHATVGANWFILEHNLRGALLSANNLSDLTNAATARTNLALVPGVNIQAWDADLDAIAALTGTTGVLRKTAANTWELDNSVAAGSVTSVGLSAPDIFTVSNSPVTTSGTLTFTLNSQPAAQFLASPAGASGTPLFRGIVASDIPTLNQNTTGTASNVTGTVAATNGGTGNTSYNTGDILYASAPNVLSKLPAGTEGQVLQIVGGVPSWVTLSGGTF